MLALLNVPAPQTTHLRSVFAEPSVSTLVPALHVCHSTQGVSERPSSSHVPGSHARLAMVPPAQNVPASQGAQTAAELDVAATTSTVPAGHAAASWHFVWLIPVVVVPPEQGTHTRFSLALGPL